MSSQYGVHRLLWALIAAGLVAVLGPPAVARAAEPACDFRVAAADGSWVDDQVTVTVGDTTRVAGFDFPPEAEIVIDIKENSPLEGLIRWTDADGYFEAEVTWEDDLEGVWTLRAYPVNAGCEDPVDDSVGIVVEAAPVPDATAGTIPDVAMERPRGTVDLPWSTVVLALLALGVLAVPLRSRGHSSDRR